MRNSSMTTRVRFGGARTSTPEEFNLRPLSAVSSSLSTRPSPSRIVTRQALLRRAEQELLRAGLVEKAITSTSLPTKA